MTSKFLALKVGKMGIPFIEIGNPRRRAVVSGFRLLAFVRRRGKGRDHKFGCGRNEAEIPPGHLRRDVE